MGIPHKAYNQYSNPWKDWQIEKIKKHYDNGNYSYLSNLIGRSPDAVRMMCYKLNLRRIKKWGKDEIEILKNNCKFKDNKGLSKLINRSAVSIKSKLHELNLKRDENFRKKIFRKIGLVSHKWSNKSKKDFSEKLKKDYRNGKIISNFILYPPTKEDRERGALRRKETLIKNPSIEQKRISNLKKFQKANPQCLENMRIKLAIDRRINPEKYKKIDKIYGERCSDQILDKDRRRKIKNTMIKKFSKNKEILLCEFCSGEIINSKTNKYTQRFCSIKCARAKQIFPKKDSSIEIKIQNFLKQLGIEFFTHQYMKEIEHGYQCDILIPSMNMVIECDGDYWHKYPIGNDLDHIRTSELLKGGFKVLRLWEFEINNMTIEEFERRLK